MDYLIYAELCCRCFLLLLLVAAVLWKLKQKYDTYRRRQVCDIYIDNDVSINVIYNGVLVSQRLFVEMVQMARRPFSSINVEIDPKNPQEDVATISVSDTLSRRKKVHECFIFDM